MSWHTRRGTDRRAVVRQNAAETGFNEKTIQMFVQVFYEKVRANLAIGPVFENVVSDWSNHNDTMERFCRSVLMMFGEYSGKTVQAHLVIPGIKITQFSTWLKLLRETLNEVRPSSNFHKGVKARAQNIGDALTKGIARNDQTEAQVR